MTEEDAFEQYDVAFIGKFDVGRKKVLGPRHPTICRFCDRAIPEVTFSKTAHAIPELLGNRQLIVSDECDACNEFFGNALEDHLARFTKPFRVIGQVRGKKGVPNCKAPMKKSRVDFTPGVGLGIHEHADEPLIELAEEQKQIKLTLAMERHSPVAVYKALVKIALSVMTAEELENFGVAKKWIRDTDHSKVPMKPLKLLLFFVPGPLPHVGASIMLLRKKATTTVAAEKLPYAILVLAFGNLQLQVMVPARADNREQQSVRSLSIPRFPSAIASDSPFGAPIPLIRDLTNASAEPSTVTITLQYESVDETGPFSDE